MKRTGRVLSGAVLLLAAGGGGIAFFFDADQFRPRLEAALTESLRRPTHIGKLNLSIFQGRIAAEEFSIAEDPAFGKVPFVQAKAIALQVELWPLIRYRKLNVTGISIAQPLIVLSQNKKGVWNFSRLGAAGANPLPAAKVESEAVRTSAPLDLSVKLLEISGARVTVDDSSSPTPLVLENTGITIHDFKPSAAFPFSVSARLASGGDIMLDGKAGPVNPADSSNMPVELTAKITGLRLEPYGAAGLLSMSGKGSTDGRELDWSGQIRLEQAKFVAAGMPATIPITLDFRLRHNLQRHFGALTRGTLHAGKADARITGSYARNEDKVSVNMQLAGVAMPIPDLLAVLPAFDIRLPAGSSLQGGTVSADLRAVGPAEAPVLAGKLVVANTRLTGFDLGSKMPLLESLVAIQPSPDTDIRQLTAALRIGPGGTAIDDLDVVAPSMGELTGSGTVAPTHELDFKMRAAVHTTSAVMAAIGAKNDTVIPFFIQGTSTNPVFKPDAGAIAAGQLEKWNKTIGGAQAGKAIDAIQDFFGRGRKR